MGAPPLGVGQSLPCGDLVLDRRQPGMPPFVGVICKVNPG